MPDLTFSEIQLDDTDSRYTYQPSPLSEELRTFCRERIAGYKVPREVSFTTLPRSEAGKLNKKALRNRLQARMAAAAAGSSSSTKGGRARL